MEPKSTKPKQLWDAQYKVYKIPADFNDPKHFVSSPSFAGVSKRVVGIEIECMPGRTYQNRKNAAYYNYECTNPFCDGNCRDSIKGNAQFEDCLKFYRALSKIDKNIGHDDDASLQDGGVEIQTSPKSGANLVNHINKVAKLLEQYGFYTDRRCGLHLHLDMPDYSSSDLRKVAYLVAVYARLEPYLYYSATKNSRYSNRYCLPIAASVEKLGIRDLVARENNMTKKQKMQNANLIRRWGIDITYIKGITQGTHEKSNIEVRYHHGTVDAGEILPWIEINQAIIDFVSVKYDAGEVNAIRKVINDLLNAPPKKVGEVLMEQMGVRKKVVDYFKAKIKRKTTGFKQVAGFSINHIKA